MKAMKYTILALFASSMVFSVFACSSDDDSSSDQTALALYYLASDTVRDFECDRNSQSAVRVANNSGGIYEYVMYSSADCSSGNVASFDALSDTASSEYACVTAGRDYSVSIIDNAGDNCIAVDTSVTLEAGLKYTISHDDGASPATPADSSDDTMTPAKDV